MTNRFGIIGIIVGLIAIGVAAGGDSIRELIEPEPTSIAERVLETGAAILTGEARSSTSERDYVTVSYIALGFVAIVLAVISFLRHENQRVTTMAGVLGVMAVGWSYILIGLAISVVLIILVNFDFSDLF